MNRGKLYANGHMLGHVDHEPIRYDEIITSDNCLGVFNGIERRKRRRDESSWVIDAGLLGKCWDTLFIDEPSQHQIHKEKAGMIKKVIFSGPCTIVLWTDGTKTVVRSQEGDIYDKEKGLAMAFAKKLFGNTSYYYDIFREHLKEDDAE